MAARDYKTIDILGHTMAYQESGQGEAIILLHGNPTSSYLWRDVVPPLSVASRCIVPDLIGFGRSQKLPPVAPDGEDGRYSFAMHADHLAAFIDTVCPGEPVTLVVHDWGSALGFDWASRNEKRVKAIAYLESMIAHRRYRDMSLKAAIVFFAVRNSRVLGRKLILERNLFVEQGIPSYIRRNLSDEEMAAYREPFDGDIENRRPILSFQRDLPVNGRPRHVHERFDNYMVWLQRCNVPKLFINAVPGYQISGRRRRAARLLPNQTEITISGLHYVQEDAGREIGEAIARWLKQKPDWAGIGDGVGRSNNVLQMKRN